MPVEPMIMAFNNGLIKDVVTSMLPGGVVAFYRGSACWFLNGLIMENELLVISRKSGSSDNLVCLTSWAG